MANYGLVLQVKGTGDTGVAKDNLVLSGIPDRCIYITRVTVENLTNDNTVAKLGIKRGGTFMTLDYKAAFNKLIPQIWSQQDLRLYEFDDLVVRVTGALTSDEILINVIYDVVRLIPDK